MGATAAFTKLKDSKTIKYIALNKVKIYSLSDKEKQNALNEVRILASIKHENIISYKEAFISTDR